MIFTKRERLGLLLTTAIFTFIGAVQLWRAVSGVSVMFNGSYIPDWVSVIVGIFALSMAVWMGSILRHHRPII
jgi:hypothetical protein